MYGTGALVSMLTPDLRPLMGLPSPTSPTVGLFPTQGKSQVPQVNEIDLVDSEQLTPDGLIHPSQKLGSLKQDISTVPLVKSPVDALPTPQPVVKNGRVFETLREGLDSSEQALTVPETDLTAQDTTTPRIISASSESQVGTLLESEASAFTLDNESQPLSALEEGHSPGHNDEWVVCTLRGSDLKLITSTGNLNTIAFADPLSCLVNLIKILWRKTQQCRHSDANQWEELPLTMVLAGNCKDCSTMQVPLFWTGRDSGVPVLRNRVVLQPLMRRCGVEDAVE